MSLNCLTWYHRQVVESGGKNIEVAVMTREESGLRQLEEGEIDAIVAEIEAEKAAAEAAKKGPQKETWYISTSVYVPFFFDVCDSAAISCFSIVFLGNMLNYYTKFSVCDINYIETTSMMQILN